jgi:hypothetical protein
MHLKFLSQPARTPARAASFSKVPVFRLNGSIETGVNGAAGFNANNNDASDGGFAAMTLLESAAEPAKAKQTNARVILNIFENGKYKAPN